MKRSELIAEIKRRLPPTIDVMGVPFTVKFSWNMGKADRKTYAWTVVEDREITVAARKIKSMEHFRSTLIHELLHAALGTSGVTYGITDAQEEQVIVCLEAFIAHQMDFKRFDLEHGEGYD